MTRERKYIRIHPKHLSIGLDFLWCSTYHFCFCSLTVISSCSTLLSLFAMIFSHRFSYAVQNFTRVIYCWAEYWILQRQEYPRSRQWLPYNFSNRDSMMPSVWKMSHSRATKDDHSIPEKVNIALKLVENEIRLEVVDRRNERRMPKFPNV